MRPSYPSILTFEQKREVKTYLRVILYYLRHEGFVDRECIRRCVYTVRQLMPYIPGERRHDIVAYIKSFIDNEKTLAEKIIILTKEIDNH